MINPHQADWIVPGKVLASRYPSGPDELRAFRPLGVRAVINLTVSRHSPDVLADVGLTEIHLPIPDFTAPTSALLDEAVDAITQTVAADQAVAVHCHAGLGRTGTVVAAWLVSTGISPATAIAKVREIRPGSIESASQEAAVHDYARRKALQSDNQPW